MTQPNNKKTNQQIVAEYTCMVTELSPADVRQALLFLAEKLDAAEALIAVQQQQIDKLSEPKSLKQALIDAEQIASYMKPDIRNYAGFEPWKPEEDGRPEMQPSPVAVRSATENSITFSMAELLKQKEMLIQQGFERAIELLEKEPLPTAFKNNESRQWYKLAYQHTIDVLRQHQEKGSNK